MLQIGALSKRYAQVTAVDDVTLAIPKGKMIGIIGRSGAGKSTLLRTINRLTEPSNGSIVFDGVDVTKLRGQALLDWRARCAMIFQQFNLVGRLDVITNVLIGRLRQHHVLPTLFKLFSAADRAIAIRALDRLDLADQALQRADTLSGGQQQRVAIARALVQEPRIILADEPIASLDPRSAAKVMDALHAINREDGITVICNLHTLDTARGYCDRIVGMAKGRVVFDGTPRELTPAAVRHIYGVVGDDEIRESITSTAVLDEVPARAALA
jgi:phosphonate transport system ATP-binding protein